MNEERLKEVISRVAKEVLGTKQIREDKAATLAGKKEILEGAKQDMRDELNGAWNLLAAIQRGEVTDLESMQSSVAKSLTFLERAYSAINTYIGASENPSPEDYE